MSMFVGEEKPRRTAIVKARFINPNQKYRYSNTIRPTDSIYYIDYPTSCTLRFMLLLKVRWDVKVVMCAEK